MTLRNFIYAYPCPHCYKLVKPTLSAAKQELLQPVPPHLLKLMPQTIIHLLKQASSFLRSVALAVKQRRRQNLLNGLEAERLDRIRNPSKYLGK